MAELPKIIGSFRVLRVLGQGGMGVVYEAVDEAGARVAIKTVLGGRGRLHLAVRREIHALARLHHPGIVGIVDEGEHQGVPWYAMAYVDGVTLRRFRSVLSAPTVMRAPTELAKGSSVTEALAGRAPGPLETLTSGGALESDFLALVAGALAPGAEDGSDPIDPFGPSQGGRASDTLSSAGMTPSSMPEKFEAFALGAAVAEPADATGTGTGITPDEFAGLAALARGGAPAEPADATGTGSGVTPDEFAGLMAAAAGSPLAAPRDDTGTGGGLLPDEFAALVGGAPGATPAVPGTEGARGRPREGSAAAPEEAHGTATRAAAASELDRLRRELLSATSAPGEKSMALDHRTGRVVALDDEGRKVSRGGKPLEPAGLERALELAERLCDVLAYLHGEGMVHRDLKPDNVLVDRDARPVLLDFGLVTHATGRVGRESFDEVQTLGAGTAPYIAPEQILGELVDARADLYALGCILYEMVDGRPPFQGTVAQVFKQHLFDKHAALREAHPWVPAALDELIDALLAKRPVERLGSASVVARRLAAIAGRAPLDRQGPTPRPLLFRPPVAGRGAQLQTLRESLRASRGGQGQLVFVGGPSGYGKTRLALEIAREAAASGKLLVTGECVAQGGRPLQPLRRLLQSVAERCVSKGSKETTRLGAGARVLAAYEPSLSGIPGIDELPDPPPLSGREARQRVFDMLWSTMELLAEGEGLVMFLDDLHWADELTLGFLAHVAERFASGRQLPALLVSTYRDDEAPEELGALAALPNATALRVDKLDEAAVAEIVAGCLGQPKPPKDLAGFVGEHATGNPFFVTEYVRAAVEAGALEPRHETSAELWRELPDKVSLLPKGPRELLMLRMRGVTGVLRDVAEAAAVLGAECDLATLRRSVGLSNAEVFDAVDELRRRQIVDDAPGERLQIVHDKLAAFLVESVPDKERAARHGRAARAIEATRGDQVAESADALAYHYAAAGEPAAAVEHLLSAGDQARALYATKDAVRRYQRAAELLIVLGDHDRAAKTLMKLGLVHTAAFHTEAARDAYDQAFALWAEHGARGPDTMALAPARLSIAIGDPLSLDPARTYDTDSAFLQAQLFEGLVQLDVDFNVLPAVARRWSVAADGRRYRFELREDACWSDGRPLNAIDFEMAWKRNLSPGTQAPAAQLLYCVEGAEDVHSGRVRDVDTVGIRAVSRLELDVTLRGPTAYFPYLLAHPITFPQPWWLIHAEGRRWTHPALIVGNGPYLLTERRERESLRLVKNQEYAGRFKGNAGDIDCRIFHSYQDSYAAYHRGDVDVLDLISAPLDVIREARRAHRGELRDFPLLSTTYLSFASSRAPFSDPRVRRAFAHAVDRKALAARLEGGEHEVALGGFIPKGMPGHQEGIVPAFDLVRARELLAEAGFDNPADLPTLRWLHSHGLGDATVVEELARGWRDGLGVRIDIQTVRFEELEDEVARNRPDLLIGAWIADYPDPDSFLRATFHSVEGHEPAALRDARYDQLVSQAAVATTVQERLDLYAQADRLLVSEEVGVLPVSYGRNLVLLKLEVAYFPRSSSYLRALKNVMIARGAS